MSMQCVTALLAVETAVVDLHLSVPGAPGREHYSGQHHDSKFNLRRGAEV